jgi:hypothetical protein
MHRLICTVLTKKGIPFFLDVNSNADAAVTTQWAHWLRKYNGLRFRTQYGVGAVTDSYGHGMVNQGMDSVFVHGSFSASEISRVLDPSKVVITGFPKYSPIFRGEIDRDSSRKTLQIPDGAPVVAYFPTWAHNSSLDLLSDEVIDLAKHFTVIVKPHHNNLELEQERLDKLEGSNGVVVNTKERSIVPFISAADVVLADVRSGSFTEAILMDKPVVGLSPNPHENDDHLIPQAFSAASVCRNPSDLKAIVESAAYSDTYKAGRKLLSSHLFTWQFGYDDMVTADAMITSILGG